MPKRKIRTPLLLVDFGGDGNASSFYGYEVRDGPSKGQRNGPMSVSTTFALAADTRRKTKSK